MYQNVFLPQCGIKEICKDTKIESSPNVILINKHIAISLVKHRREVPQINTSFSVTLKENID